MRPVQGDYQAAGASPGRSSEMPGAPQSFRAIQSEPPGGLDRPRSSWPVGSLLAAGGHFMLALGIAARTSLRPWLSLVCPAAGCPDLPAKPRAPRSPKRTV